IGLVLGAIPIFAAIFGLVLGTERPTGRFWVGALFSFVGVGVLGAGGGGELSNSLWGILLGLSTAATWAAYSVVVGPLMGTYSPSRMSAFVLPATWVLIALCGIPQTSDQDGNLAWRLWPLRLVAA